MKLTELDDIRKQSFVALLIMAMYADAHLALAENNRLKQALLQLGVEDEYSQETWIRETLTLVRRRTPTPEERTVFLSEIAANLRPVRARALHVLEELLTSDGAVTDRECDFVNEVREVLK